MRKPVKALTKPIKDILFKKKYNELTTSERKGWRKRARKPENGSNWLVVFEGNLGS